MRATTSKPEPAPQASKRIERLESRVGELSAALGRLMIALGHGPEFMEHVLGGDLPLSVLQEIPAVLARRATDGAELNPDLSSAVAANEHPARPSQGAQGGLAGAAKRGEAARVDWVRSGEVVPAKALAERWGLTPQALGPAAARGEVFSTVIKSHRYYPREFLELDRDEVGAVCRALGSLTPQEKLIFWKKPHGALAGKTVLQALGRKRGEVPMREVLQLAQAKAAQAGANQVESA
jgi:hypothetical protein